MRNIPGHAAAITADDTHHLDATSCLYVGTGGDVAVYTEEGETVTFANVPSGTFMPIAVIKVMDTNTTASDIVALW